MPKPKGKRKAKAKATRGKTTPKAPKNEKGDEAVVTALLEDARLNGCTWATRTLAKQALNHFYTPIDQLVSLLPHGMACCL